jgi:hypothetical protein
MRRLIIYNQTRKSWFDKNEIADTMKKDKENN